MDKLNLDKCSLNTHALISLDNISITPESLEVLSRLNNGGEVLLSEYAKLPVASSSKEIRVNNAVLLEELVKLCRSSGRDLQSLFRCGDVEYLSLFLNPKDEKVNDFFFNSLKIVHPAFFAFWQGESIDEITVSFPEK